LTGFRRVRKRRPKGLRHRYRHVFLDANDGTSETLLQTIIDDHRHVAFEGDIKDFRLISCALIANPVLPKYPSRSVSFLKIKHEKDSYILLILSRVARTILLKKNDALRRGNLFPI
jgi:hypothetical protein